MELVFVEISVGQVPQEVRGDLRFAQLLRVGPQRRGPHPDHRLRRDRGEQLALKGAVLGVLQVEESGLDLSRHG